MISISILLFFNLIGFVFADFDHQTKTYVANHGHQVIHNANLDLVSFFSPDTSQEVFTAHIQSAKHSIDISTPNWNSWSGCTSTNANGEVGCPVEFVRKHEQFPVFQALLNAIHKGIKVRIITNNFEKKVGKGLITPLDFLVLAGAETTAFATLTFLHTKFVLVDDERALISSVNYDYTSFMENREAGLIVGGQDAAPLIAFSKSILNLDISIGTVWKTNSYNSSDMAIINDKSLIPVVQQPARTYKGAYVSKARHYNGHVKLMKLIANPDDAWQVIGQGLRNATKSLHIYVYQVTAPQFCDAIETAHKNGLFVKLLVSDRIDSTTDYYKAEKCYKKLKQSGITVRKCNKYIYHFEHEKFWIVDDETLFLSSGNMAETDFPTGSNVFPPKTDPNWRDTNRDHTVQIQSKEFAEHYKHLLEEDYKRGYDF